MSSFRATLEHLLEKHDLKQAELARRTKLLPAAISRYLTGTRPEMDVLEKLGIAFEADGPELVAAWLRDEIPALVREKITVEVAHPRQGDDEALHLLSQLGPRERGIFVELIKRSQENPAMLPLLQQLLNVTAE
jgi:transcriptional regulator with XRE-family HTH domain